MPLEGLKGEMLSFNISLWDLIKFPYFADATERVERYWKQAQNTGWRQVDFTENSMRVWIYFCAFGYVYKVWWSSKQKVRLCVFCCWRVVRVACCHVLLKSKDPSSAYIYQCWSGNTSLWPRITRTLPMWYELRASPPMLSMWPCLHWKLGWDHQSN